jgi:hypothetical protein
MMWCASTTFQCGSCFDNISKSFPASGRHSSVARHALLAH